MDHNSKIYIAGHYGLVDYALMSDLTAEFLNWLEKLNQRIPIKKSEGQYEF